MKLFKSKHFLPIFASCAALSVFTYTVLLSYFVPLIDEDFSLYAHGKPIADVIAQCISQYTQWNARIGDVLSILFSTLPQAFYNILNGLCICGFLLLLVYVAKVITAKTRVDIFSWATLVIILFLALVFYIPAPNEVFFWRTGAANYFYPTLFSLLYTLPLLRYVISSRNIKSPIVAILYVLAGVVVGHSNENVAPVVFAFFAFWVVLMYFRQKRLSITLLSSTIALLVGVCLLLFGPSTQHRIEFYSQLYGSSSVLQNITHNLIPVLTDYWVLIIPSVVMTALLAHYQYDLASRKKLYLISLLSYTVSVVSVFILLCAPYYTSRALFFSAVILLIPVIASLVGLPRRFMPALFAIFLALLLMATPLLFDQLVAARRVSHEKSQLIQSVEEQLTSSSRAVVKPVVVEEPFLIYNGYPPQEVTRMAHFFHYPEGSIKIE